MTEVKGQGGQRPRKRRRLGKRRRRLRITAAIVAAVAAAATVAGVLWYRASRTEVRRPGEELPEITERLSRGLPADAPEPAFTDATAAAGLSAFRSFAGDRSSQLPEDMGSGAAWGDYDGDGDDDLFLVSSGGSLRLPPDQWAPSELYENRGDGTFRRKAGFPELRISGMGAAWGDYDGDGRLDLAVSGYRFLGLFRNQGEGRFARVDLLPSPDGYWAGISWADFDGDRDLDLYVCGYVQYQEAGEGERRMSQQYGAAVPYTLNPASFEPERNLLFRNDGGEAFEEVALPYGVSNPEGRSLGALWHDFDGDGRLDLYVANDISDNALFLNRGETFEDVGLTAWVADYRGAMGLAAGDWNRDGDDDLFITHWLAQENALYDSHLADRREPPPGGPSPTTAPAPPRLTFSDLASPLGLGQIALHMVGWGTEFADLDGDGWLDLVVADGSTLENDATPKGLKPQEPLVLWNRDGEHFHDLAPLSELLSTPHVSRGMAVSDYDHDGDLDLLFVHWGEGVQLLRNEMPRGHWLEVALRSRGSDGRITGRGEGSTVVAWVGEVPLRRSLTEGSYLSQSSATLHFGLGDAPAVDRLEVHWLGGETATYGRLEGDARWEITEGSETPKRLGEALQAAAQADPADSRERVVAFWQKQRAGMDAMKREGDLPKAIAFFRQALELNPEHEDSRYYLATCLAAEGHPDEALHHLDVLRRQNPMSHRGHLQWATLRAETATSRVDLEAAEAAAERALEINREETGSLLLLGEIELLLGEPDRADQRLAQATRTNPKAVGGYFLRGFLAWRRGDAAAAAELLEAAQTARGPDWKPEGAAAEGDVQTRMHSDDSPLDRFWRRWDGSPDPKTAFRPLADYLATQAPARSG